jgi:hypothetical protein
VAAAEGLVLGCPGLGQPQDRARRQASGLGARYGLYDKDDHEKAISAIPLMGSGTPGDVFALADFIVNESTYTAGQNFFVNGGNYLE